LKTLYRDLGSSFALFRRGAMILGAAHDDKLAFVVEHTALRLRCDCAAIAPMSRLNMFKETHGPRFGIQ